MKKTNFQGTQQNLYTIARLAWQSCGQHLADFTAFKSKYDATLIATNTDAIDAAEAIPDNQTRSGESEILRAHLIEKNETILNLWQKLKRYIAEAFPEVEQKARVEQSGSNYYNKARHLNWDGTESLSNAAQQFIATNDAVLQDNGFMPVAFATAFSDAKIDFSEQHQSFLDSEETAKQGTQTKQIANNELHKNLMIMMLDGQEVFRNNEAIKKQFIYNEVYEIIAGQGQAGLRGNVNSSSNSEGIIDASISIEEIGKQVATNQEGYYELKPLPSGTYVLQVYADGYETKILKGIKVLVGTVSTLNIQLTPIEGDG